MAVNIPGLIAVIVFYILILATGIWASRKAKKEEKKCTGNKSEVSMVGGRNMNLWVGIFTTTATWVGGGYIMGTAEVVYDPAMGLIWSTQPLAYALSLFVEFFFFFILGGLFFAKPMRDKNYVTMMDPFQIRYGNTLMSLLSVPVLIAEVAWAANILAALGGTIYVILGIASYQSILMSGGVAILYTLLGGLYSVSYTDVIQLLFIFVSLWLCIPFLMLNPASTDIIYTAVDELYQAPWVGKLDLVDLWRWLDDLLLMVFSSVCYQDFYQRVLATSSTAHAQKMCYAAAVFCFFLGVPSMLIGAIAASTDWNQTSYGLPTPYEKGEAGIILPIALQHLCPVYISIAGIGAIAAAVMSSMDSALLAAGSMFAFNIYKNMLRKRASDREVLWVIKISVIFFGVAAMGIAMITTSMYGLGIISGELLYSILFPQTVCILFVPMSNGYGASVGLVVGLTLRLLGGDSFLNFPPVIPYPGCTLVDGVYVQLFPFKTLTMLLSLFSIVSVSYLTSLLFKRGLLPKKWDIFYASKKTDIILKETELSPINNEEDVGGNENQA
ncbi:high-affinity choline transporter 1-like isoform X1 [Acipenser ruthenus]|uniref:high-affinity choline transporter 1-like isoform X1 n=1 Tax=Acipenser ruthenus TaxID=7906 RepID=UPI00274210AE|nr:high-affinity choline transporter 1-like isoform X1 [Acipenser ruthenus]